MQVHRSYVMRKEYKKIIIIAAIYILFMMNFTVVLVTYHTDTVKYS